MEPEIWFVCVMGIGVVFLGLICIIFISVIASSIIRAIEKHSKKKPAVEASLPQPEPIQNRGEFVAAVSTAIAEQLGTDINAIRIKSIKKV